MKSKELVSQLKTKKIAELNKLLESKKTDLQQANFDLNFGKNKNVAIIGGLKKEIARINTIINEAIYNSANIDGLVTEKK